MRRTPDLISGSLDPNADGYYIYRKTSAGKYKKIKTIKFGDTTSFIDKSGKSGSVYAVRPYNITGKGKNSAAVSA